LGQPSETKPTRGARAGERAFMVRGEEGMR